MIPKYIKLITCLLKKGTYIYLVSNTCLGFLCIVSFGSKQPEGGKKKTLSAAKPREIEVLV